MGLYQNNLGKVLQALGEKESGSGLLHQAAAYQAALLDGVLCPSSIAAANINLGNAFLLIGERENGITSLKEAAAAYRVAFEAQPKMPLRLTWRGRKSILPLRWEHNSKLLEEALRAVNAALNLIEGLTRASYCRRRSLRARPFSPR